MLASRRTTSFALQLVLPAVLFGGCVVKSSDTDNDPIQTTSSSTTSSSTSSGGGEGGQGGGGGEGGAGGSGPACVGADGTGQTAAYCEELNVAPAQGASSQCGPGLDELPPGYAVCKHGFTVFAPGHAEDLAECLSTIEVQYACDEGPVNECFQKMSSRACPHQNIVDSCNQIAETCGAEEPIDPAKCATDLNTFSDAALQDIAECINSEPPDVGCQTALNNCYDRTLAVDVTTP